MSKDLRQSGGVVVNPIKGIFFPEKTLTNSLGILLLQGKKLVFDAIPILAVWPVSVSYCHSVVGILVGITD